MKPSQLLAERSRWCQYAAGQACDGAPCGAFATGAVRWCLLAAMQLYTGLPMKQQELRLRATPTWRQWCEDNRKAPHPLTQTVWDFNDSISHETLLESLREANL